MRVAFITFTKKKSKKFNAIVKNLSNAAQKSGLEVHEFNGNEDLMHTRLTIFDYLVVVYQSSSFFSAKLPQGIQDFFSSAGSILGKKASVFIVNHGLRSAKQCQNMMKVLESQGVVVDYFDIIQNTSQALVAGKKIG